MRDSLFCARLRTPEATAAHRPRGTERPNERPRALQSLEPSARFPAQSERHRSMTTGLLIHQGVYQHAGRGREYQRYRPYSASAFRASSSSASRTAAMRSNAVAIRARLIVSVSFIPPPFHRNPVISNGPRRTLHPARVHSDETRNTAYRNSYPARPAPERFVNAHVVSSECASHTRRQDLTDALREWYKRHADRHRAPRLRYCRFAGAIGANNRSGSTISVLAPPLLGQDPGAVSCKQSARSLLPLPFRRIIVTPLTPG